MHVPPRVPTDSREVHEASTGFACRSRFSRGAFMSRLRRAVNLDQHVGSLPLGRRMNGNISRLCGIAIGGVLLTVTPACLMGSSYRASYEVQAAVSTRQQGESEWTALPHERKGRRLIVDHPMASVGIELIGARTMLVLENRSDAALDLRAAGVSLQEDRGEPRPLHLSSHAYKFVEPGPLAPGAKARFWLFDPSLRGRSFNPEVLFGPDVVNDAEADARKAGGSRVGRSFVLQWTLAAGSNRMECRLEATVTGVRTKRIQYA